MGGVVVDGRRPASMARLAGAAALACALAAVALPGVVAAQSFGVENASISDSAEMLLEADTIVYDHDQETVTAVGGVQIDYDGRKLVAQRVRYDRSTARLIATGNVEVVDSDGTRMFSQEIDITDDFLDGFVRALRVEAPDRTFFAAESAERRDGTLTTFNHGVYTACEPCEDKPDKKPVWQVRAQKIIWNGQTKTIRFEQARLEMFGMPLAFLPAFEIADPTVRQKSGFLTPSYSSSSDLGHGVHVPYYWALSPTYDVTFRPAWYSRQGFLGIAEWRQRFDSGHYSVTIAGIRQRSPEEFYSGSGIPPEVFSDNRTWRGMIGSKGAFRINPRWTFGWDVMAQTDKNFSHTYGVSGYSEVRRTNEVYLTGLNDRNYFDLRAYRFQVQEAYREDFGNQRMRDARQPWVLPSFDYSYTPDEPVFGGELNLDVNLQVVSRSELDRFYYPGATINPQSAVRGIDGTSSRLTAEVEWKRTFVTHGGLLLTPILHGRGDAIGVSFEDNSVAAIQDLALRNGVDAEIRSSYYRAMATAGLEARYPVLFSTSSSTHVLEPMAQIFVRPDEAYGGSVGIPNEDAQSLVFDASTLFERDKFSGYDRMEGGVRANLGLRYSGAFGDGWSLNALAGQSFHLAGRNSFASPDLTHVGAFSGLESDRSDYVASVNLISPVGLSLGAGGRFDEDSFAVRRTDITAGYTDSRVAVSGAYSSIKAQPDYGYIEDRHEIRAAGSVRIHDNWRIFGNGTYDFASETMVRKSIGFSYDDECFSFSLTAREYVSATNSSQKTRYVGFQVALRTLGEFVVDSEVHRTD